MSSRDIGEADKRAPRDYSFGDFTLEVAGGFLRKGADEVALRPKTFSVLTYLVERHGRLVTKTELIDAIWGDVAVTENSLAQCLLEIRRALSDDSQRMIRTVPRRGYIFVAPVSARTLSFPRFPERVAAAEESRPRALLWPPILRRSGVYWAVALALLISVSAVAWTQRERAPRPVKYTQLTDFADSATSPAISPDGRMLAFLRGSKTFLDTGQLYVMRLPDGEPVALTQDDHLKMAPVFSPDGSRVAYTVNLSGKWETWSVPVLGGAPQVMRANAAALTWVGGGRFLFSEIKRGVQMGVVTATEQRSEVNDVYVPPGMAHRSSMSPDGRWVLISSEMNASGWLPCRVASVESVGAARIVGPPAAKCTHASWSPDGRWMYFSAETDRGFHTWRQFFPHGMPEQVTFGATEEEGIAMWPDGRSFAASVGTTVSSIWISDAGQERQITSEGYGHSPSFSTDGRTLYYLLRISDAWDWTAGELWAVDLETDTRRRILPGISMAHYEVSEDGKRVVFVRTDRGNRGVWLARTDGQLAPRQLSSDANTYAFFGPRETVVFVATEGGRRYLARMREDGTAREVIASTPFIGLVGVSRDRQWALMWVNYDERKQLFGYPLQGGPPVLVCEHCADSRGGPARGRTPPALTWSPGGRHLYLRLQWPAEPLYESGKTYVLPLSEPGGLPPMFSSEADVASRLAAQVIPHGGIFPGPHPSLYAFTRAATHRNIYRISLP